MFAITVEFEVHPDYVAEFRHAVLEQARNSLAREKQCLMFEVCHSLEFDRRFFLYEIYSSTEAFDAHKETRHYAQFTEQVTPMVEKKTVHRWYPEHSATKE
ncbi:MAG: antibiotic biosynthesis monooxygenase [Acetobacterales bacterium]